MNQGIYAQGAVSFDFKEVLKSRIEQAKTADELACLLNDVHDAVLVCRNSPDGLRAAVERLKQTSRKEIKCQENRRVVNYTWVTYVPVAVLAVWQYFDQSPWVYAALGSSAVTVILMHMRDDLEKRINR